ncbi:Coenzyme F420 hydrogenase/dehydrogenase, beta subunit C-terminal domain, partial [bacterium]|nr:Coenzyme F420 hydrogenase/dehydrogenase, beta subunit C-terminal domain [bacterium]
KKEVKNLTGMNFRPKDKGWGVIVVTRYIDGKPKYISTLRDSFMKAFLNNLSLNDCCVECRFNKLPRVADITMGDFWGVDLYDKSINDKKGLSVVLVNSQKGQEMFDKIKSDGVCTELPLEVAIKFNHNIVGTTLPHPKRDEFFERLNDESLEKLTARLVGKVAMFKESVNMILPQKVTRFIRKYLLGRKDV